jgi:hypothetical protein
MWKVPFLAPRSRALPVLWLALSACAGDKQGDDGAGAGQSGASTVGGAGGHAGTSAASAGRGTGGATGGSGAVAGSAGSSIGTTGGATSAGASGRPETTGGAGSTAGSATGGNANLGGASTGGTSSGGVGGSGGTVAGGAGGASAGSGGQMMDLPPGVTGLFPGPNATSVCKDPQLRLTFPAPPKLGSSGTIQVLSGSGTVVASVNMASMTVTDTIGGMSFSLERRAYVDGNTAVIYLPSKGLSYGQSYYVNVPEGAIVPSGGGSFSITGSSAWKFSTASAAPASLANLTVALDGSGAFCSVQGAVDALPSNSSQATTITVNSGSYHEVIYWKSKSNITLHGQSRKETILLGTNNNNMNPSTKGRALIGVDSSSGLVFENLTIHNLTPQGGSQAEALRLEGCTHCTIRDADILSLQDTLLWSGTLYAKNCYIAGNVDFIWGTGAAYFDQCEIKTVGRSGYVVQSRNGTSGYGYVFVDSKITADAGVTGSVLARIDVSVYPGSHVAYIDCAMGTHISSAGWTITGGSPSSSLRFWEYQSTDLDGNALNVSGRLTGSTQISSSQAASMRDPSVVLGGWQP